MLFDTFVDRMEEREWNGERDEIRNFCVQSKKHKIDRLLP